MLGSSAVLYIGFLLRTAFRQSCADLFKCFPMLHNVMGILLPGIQALITALRHVLPVF